MSKFAWVTLTTNDTYSLGALVLAHSLRRAGTAHQLAVLVTPGVSESMRAKLKDVYNVVQEVNVMDSQDAANLALLSRPELGITFTKLHCWRLVQFEKCVFMDADTLVLQNCDELFEREELSAAPDVSWPDCFNSGVFVYRPSLDTFAKITEFALKNGSFDGGDQGLLNSYFAEWAHTDIQKHLPFVYNVTAYASYCYLPAFKQFRDKIKILHFAGKMKPWLVQFNSESRTPCTPTDYAHASDVIQLWWNIFCDNVHPKLSDEMNYWRAIMPWIDDSQNLPFERNCHYNNNYNKNNNYYHDQQEHDHDYENNNQHDRHYHENQDQSSSQFDFYLGNIKDFRDPWEDYYENLNRELNEQNSYHDGDEVEENFEQQQQQQHQQQQHEEEQKQIEHYNEPAHEEGHHYHVEVVYNSIHDSANDREANRDETPSYDSTIEAVKLEQQQEQYQQEEKNQEHHQQEHYQQEHYQQEHYQQEHRQQEQEQEQQHHQEHQQELRHQPNNETSTNVESKTATRNDSTVESIEILDTHSDSVAFSEQSCTESEAGLAGALSQLRMGEQRTPEQDAYEQMMRRQCWESGQIDYAGKDSFDNIWKQITQTMETKASVKPDDKSEPHLTSADIEDGKIEYDPATKASTQYKLIDGGYEMHITTPQPNGTIKTQVRTFWDPKPVSEADLAQEMANKKLVKSRLGKEIRIDKNTTMLTREIPGGYEEVYTTVNDDGSRSMRTKTFYDSVPQETGDDTTTSTTKKMTTDKAKKTTTTRKSSVDSTDSTESRRIVQKVQQQQQQQKNVQEQQTNFSQESTIEETRRVTQNIEITENNRTVRKNSLQEQSHKAITQTSNTGSDNKKTTTASKKKPKSAIPPPPADFVENDSTTVSQKRVPGGVEYTYSTTLESGKTITTTKTVYAEEEVEMTEEEIKQYKKTLKEAEKHKNVNTTKKLKSESGTKKVVPSENPGDVTTVETIKIEGGTEYHYTTVTAEGIVKKAVKTIYDPVPCKANPDDTDEEEIVEEYEEEIIEPGEKNIRTIETVRQLPHKFEEEVTITHEKKEKKVKKSMMISQ